MEAYERLEEYCILATRVGKEGETQSVYCILKSCTHSDV